MKINKLNNLSINQKLEILNLWNHEYPENLKYQSLTDFENYLNNLTEPEHYILLNSDHKIRAWAFTFIRAHEKWFAIIVSSELQKKGIGTQLLNCLKSEEKILNGWVIDSENYTKTNGEKYKSPLNFYVKNNFKILTETRLELETISAVKINWTL